VGRTQATGRRAVQVRAQAWTLSRASTASREAGRNGGIGAVETWLAVGTLAVGALVWLIRLEGRVNLNERLTTDLSEDVKYIRDRIDLALNGNRKSWWQSSPRSDD
jgi:hypothetical protein